MKKVFCLLIKLIFLVAWPLVLLYLYGVMFYEHFKGELPDEYYDEWYVPLLGPLAGSVIFYYCLLKSQSLETFNDELDNVLRKTNL